MDRLGYGMAEELVGKERVESWVFRCVRAPLAYNILADWVFVDRSIITYGKTVLPRAGRRHKARY